MDKQKLLDIGIQFRGGKFPSETWDSLNKKYGCPFKSGEGFRCFVKKELKKQNKLPTKDGENIENIYKTTIEIGKDNTQTSDRLIRMSEEDAKDVDYLLKAHGYDILQWELVSARNNIWNVYSKQDGVQILYSSKITVKPRSEYLWNEEDIQRIINNIRIDYSDKINIIPKRYDDSGNILVLPIADFHYNLLADEYSTGNNYNTEIAKEYYYHVLNDVVERTMHERFEKVLFVVGNDFVNADNINGTTTKGTPQDNNTAWFNIINNVTQLIVDGVSILGTIAPVDVLYVPSNHDLHTMYGIMQIVNAWFRNDKNVKVDSSPLPRKYYKFGETLLGFSHDIKVKDALQIFTSEAKDMWSYCTHMIWILAHLHKQMIYDKQGYLEIKRLPTISGWSRWSNNNGYVQSDKKNQAFIINKDLGITNVINTVIK
jgi:hypothetical protein